LVSIGLMLRDFSPYDDTPPDAHPILSSGVDGIHWSGMAADVPSGYVVVMTLPASNGVNLVLGESLREFLALGCRSYFGGLSDLVQGFDASIEPSNPEVEDVMEALRDRFSLEPWADVPARLAELEARYGRPEGRVPRDREAEAELARRSAEFVARLKRDLGDV
jgi:hypothetical protein